MEQVVGMGARKLLISGAGDGTRTRDVQLGNKSDGCVYNNLASLARFTDSPQVSPYQRFPL